MSDSVELELEPERTRTPRSRRLRWVGVLLLLTSLACWFLLPFMTAGWYDTLYFNDAWSWLPMLSSSLLYTGVSIVNLVGAGLLAWSFILPTDDGSDSEERDIDFVAPPRVREIDARDV